MRLLILSRGRTLYTTRRLVEEAALLRHQAFVADPLHCGVACGNAGPFVFDGNGRRGWDALDSVIPRIGSSTAEHGLAVLRTLEDLAIPVVNGSVAIGRSRDKFRALQTLARNGIPVPTTALVRGEPQIAPAMRAMGGPPVVVKLPQGTQGIGVMLAESEEALEAILSTLWTLGQAALIQEFVGESRGQDLRVLVVGGQVVAAMRRSARAGDFRSNLHRGGSAHGIRLEPELARLAIRAAEILELEVAGVDILESRTGPKIIEINSSPGFEGLEGATGHNVARAIVEHALASGRVRALRRATPLGLALGTGPA